MELILSCFGLAYVVGKDVIKFIGDIDVSSFTEKSSFINNSFLDESGLVDRFEKSGLRLRWTNEDRYESRVLGGYR